MVVVFVHADLETTTRYKSYNLFLDKPIKASI